MSDMGSIFFRLLGPKNPEALVVFIKPIEIGFTVTCRQMKPAVRRPTETGFIYVIETGRPHTEKWLGF